MAIDLFLKIDGIDGESSDKEHRNWIDVLSFSLESQPGQPAPQAFHVVKSIDKATPRLFAASCGGPSPGVAVFASRKASGRVEKDFLTITMKEVVISSLAISGDGGDPPSETLTLRFASAQVHVEGAADAAACVPPRHPGHDHDGG